jgi:hypothetical protein
MEVFLHKFYFAMGRGWRTGSNHGPSAGLRSGHAATLDGFFICEQLRQQKPGQASSCLRPKARNWLAPVLSASGVLFFPRSVFKRLN